MISNQDDDVLEKRVELHNSNTELLNVEDTEIRVGYKSSGISGNSFAGAANSNSFPTKANVEGKFYGENAKELGGMIRDVSNIGSDTSWGAVFGASQ